MRIARVVSVGLPLPSTEKGSAEHQARRMEQAMLALRAYTPDFICFPEICLHVGSTLKQAVADAEPVPGPTTQRLSAVCKTLNTHVMLPLLERDADRVYNTVVLIDGQGKILGRYRKHQPTSYEMADGVHAGTEIPIFETKLGRIGIAVCFDLKFPEVGLALSRGRAELVFWPSMFKGGQRLHSWARDYGFHIVSCGVWGGKMVDPHGQTVAESLLPTDLPGLGEAHLVQSRINLDRKTYHLDYNRQKLPALLAKYGSGVEAFLMDDEGIFTLTSLLKDKTVCDIEEEFGLEDLRSYLDRAIADKDRQLGQNRELMFQHRL